MMKKAVKAASTLTPVDVKQVEAIERNPDAEIITTDAVPIEPVNRLEVVRNLPEVDVDEDVIAVTGGIEAFKGEDRRTMRVVVYFGELHQQEVIGGTQ
jgi:hypothetical protein